MFDPLEQTKFMKAGITNTEIPASTKETMDLSSVYNQYGHNFNTLIITNTSAESIKIYLDQVHILTLLGDNTVYAFDWELGIIFSELSIENVSAVNAITAGDLLITVGRTGGK